MSNTLREIRWPIALLMGVLFALSLIAPRQWRVEVRQRAANTAANAERPNGDKTFDTLARDWPPRAAMRPAAHVPAAIVATASANDVDANREPRIAVESTDTSTDLHPDPEPARPADISTRVSEPIVAPTEAPVQPPVTANAGDAARATGIAPITAADPNEPTEPVAPNVESAAPPLGILPSGQAFAPVPDAPTSTAGGQHDVPYPVPHPATLDGAGASESVATAWPMPERTIERLRELTHVEPTRTWAGEMLCVLDDLRRGVELTPKEFAAVLGHLQRLLAAGQTLEAEFGTNLAVASEITRIRLAIERRLEAWRSVYALNQSVRDDRLAARNESGDDGIVRDPKSVLRILPSSQALLADDAVALLDDIESYEASPTPHAARKIALAARKLTARDHAAARKLGQHVDLNYRNANVRVAAHGDLLNRFLPQPAETLGDVNDFVAGVPVHGTQRTRTRLLVRLLPDDRRIRFGLEAHGEVDSDTSAESGPATVFTTGETRFLARKLVTFDENRWRLFPAVAAAQNETSLSGMRTDFDPFPILNSLVHSVVRSKHEERRYGAEREIEDRVSQQAQSQLDREADPRFGELTTKATETLVEPLRRLALEPTPIALATTAERLIFRYRLAGAEQLGGHTPRPRAPGDSWLSVQLHESAINNALANLDLAGKTFELRSLYESVAARLGRADLKVPDDVPENVQVTFADENPLQVRLVDNAAHVTLRLARLDAERQTWRDLTVIAVYEPQTEGLDAVFARTSAIRLSGKNLNTRSNVVLRGVFSKMFTRNQQVHLLPDRALTDKRLADLAVNQLVVHDGWVGLAIGPRRPAGQTVVNATEDSESASRSDGVRR